MLGICTGTGSDHENFKVGGNENIGAPVSLQVSSKCPLAGSQMLRLRPAVRAHIDLAYGSPGGDSWAVAARDVSWPLAARSCSL